jgi:DNA repair exonuclease SbcCD nuclease subunit
MKVAIITDQHFGARKSSKFLHDYFKKFYDEIFFPYLEENNIKTVIDMGDTFDNRRSIDLWALEWAKENYYDRLQQMGVTVHTIVGNHTAYYKNTNSVNTVDLLLKQYENVKVYSEATEVKLDKLKVLFIPWINQENEETTFKLIQSVSCKCAMGHLELNGFRAHRGHVMEDGMESELFDKFELVFSGHYHTRSNNGKIFYLGNPYEMFWNDVNDTRGFHIFDTDTLEFEPVNNPFKLFYNVYYEDTNYKLFDAREYQSKIVKVIVKKKSDQKNFEKFIDKLYSSGIQELKIVENFEIHIDEDFEVEETENTISILNRYIDESEIDCDKSIIKGILQKIYSQACEVE